MKDKEGSTPVFFAMRASNMEMIDLVTGNSDHKQLN